MTKNAPIEPIKGNFYKKHILSIDQFSSADLKIIFLQAEKTKKLVKAKGGNEILKGKIITALFYEPSSRTFTSFMSAAQRLGAGIIPLLGMQTSSVAKGETLEDTIRTFGCTSDAIVMRHPVVGSVAQAARYSYVPVVNAGDGIGEHPTQALLDLYTIQEKHKTLSNLTGVMVGDLCNGRTTHSLLRALSLYKNNTIYILAPKQLRLPKKDIEDFKKRGLRVIEIEDITEIPKDAHFWYWTRVQKERFQNVAQYEKLKHKFVMTADIVTAYASKDTLLMHPLPRVGEIETAIDTDPRAVYIKAQMENGLYIRMALLSLVLGSKL